MQADETFALLMDPYLGALLVAISRAILFMMRSVCLVVAAFLGLASHGALGASLGPLSADYVVVGGGFALALLYGTAAS